MNDTDLYGWTNFGNQSRKFHYVPKDEMNALCKKWCISPFVPRDRVNFEPDTGLSKDDCKECRRRLDSANSHG